MRTSLFGAEYTPNRPVQHTLELENADQEAKELFALYQKVAVAEGAGTGAGGIMFSMVDFPALIAIKMKFCSSCPMFTVTTQNTSPNGCSFSRYFK